jgi:3-oxoacyl-[acyl-carrier-protein] synthase II
MRESMRRVVVTGMGMVSPLANGAELTWQRLLEGKSGLGLITHFDAKDMPARVVGEVPVGDSADGTFKADDWMSPKEQRRVDPFIVFGVAAGMQAMKDAGLETLSEEQKLRAGVTVGSGIGGLPGIESASITLHEQGYRRVSPFFIPGRLINLVSGHLSIRFGLKGPNHATVTACSSGAHAIGDAARMIMLDDADIMLAGGAEAAICAIGIAGFTQAKALSTGYNDRPAEASRPWDKGRDGFVMGEGAGLVVLEELEHAKKRGAKILAEIVGYGMSGDAYHVTAPAPDGDGAFRAMKAAFKNAGMAPSDIDYVNAHGTSTPLGDEIEFGAVKRLFGNAAGNILMSSTKSSIGHLLGAAGAIEAIFSIKAINEGIVPPTLNLTDPDEACTGIDLVPLKAKEKTVNAALSNSFGFGGTNASLIFKRFAD